MDSWFRKSKISFLATGIAIGNEAFKKNLATKLIQLRGIPAKFAQMKAITEAEDSQLWKEAVAEIEPMKNKEVEELIREINPDLSNILSLDHSQKALPASIGQVHKAKLKDGTSIAIKIRYPGIEKQLLEDTKMFGMAGKLFSMLKEGFALGDYQNTLTKELAMEMDYNNEARNQSRFYTHFAKNEKIRIPKPNLDISNESLLCQEWIASEPALSFLNHCSIKDKTEFADLICEFYFESFFNLSIVHTDPNPGNFGVIKTEKGISLIVYDFGSVHCFTENEKLALWGLFENQIDRKWDDILLLEKLGFNAQTLMKIKEKLPGYLSVILEPFLSKSRYELRTWNRKERCADILGPDKLQFMISAPANFFPIMRAFQGLLLWCEKSSGNIWIEPNVFNTRIRLSQDLADFTKSFSNTKPEFSTSFKIEVWKQKKQTIAVTLPRNAVEQLHSLIDPDILQKINLKGINIDSITKLARENGYKPMDLLRWTEGDQEIKIYLD